MTGIDPTQGVAFPWAQVITIVVGGIVSITTTIATVVFAYIKLKAELMQNTRATEAGVVKATEAANTSASVHTIVNGERTALMERLLAAEDHAARLEAIIAAKFAPPSSAG